MAFSPRLGQARVRARGRGPWPGGGATATLLAQAVASAGRTCALDPGAARVGVAIDDDLGLLAHPRGTLDPRDPKAFAAKLRELADAEHVVRFVVGLPLQLRGGEGTSARQARALAQQVADATGRVVEMWDERLSTVQAQRSLTASEVRGAKARARIDEAAACAILQSWLDARRARRGAR
jgi:putative holliday junction resolvase